MANVWLKEVSECLLKVDFFLRNGIFMTSSYCFSLNQNSHLVSNACESFVCKSSDESVHVSVSLPLPVVAVALASVVTRRAASLAFHTQGRATTATDIVSHLGPAFSELV